MRSEPRRLNFVRYAGSPQQYCCAAGEILAMGRWLPQEKMSQRVRAAGDLDSELVLVIVQKVLLDSGDFLAVRIGFRDNAT